VIPAAKVTTRAAEIDNIVALAAENNLRLNKSKTRKSSFTTAGEESKKLPPTLPDITRESSLKIIGAAFSNNQ